MSVARKVRSEPRGRLCHPFPANQSVSVRGPVRGRQRGGGRLPVSAGLGPQAFASVPNRRVTVHPVRLLLPFGPFLEAFGRAIGQFFRRGRNLRLISVFIAQEFQRELELVR